MLHDLEGCIAVQVGHVVEVLRSCNHQAFPVTPDVDKAFESAEPFDLHGMLSILVCI